MDQKTEQRLSTTPVFSLIWKMGLPMIFSMVLQSIYNIVDTIFVINMGEDGVIGNLALQYAFPVQLLMIAIGVGTGIGINSLISKSLGEKNFTKVRKVVGNSIVVGLILYLIFLIFGLTCSNCIISTQTNNEQALVMGTEYLTINCVLSFGLFGYSIFERFLQSSGKTLYSMIAQISGAVTNIILDYVFIYPLQMGIAGAAYATVIGQIVSLIVAMIFNYSLNRDVTCGFKDFKPDIHIIGEIYKVGWSAIIIQGLSAIMMYGINIILAFAGANAELIQGAYGVYGKVLQVALFATFGISNTLITVISYNYGRKDYERVKQAIKYGLIITTIAALFITVLFEITAPYLAQLFGIGTSGSQELIDTIIIAIRLGSIGYVFMGLTVAIQGIMQGFRLSIRPLILATLRLIILQLPLAYIFSLPTNNNILFWLCFPIDETIVVLIAFVMLYFVYKKFIKNDAFTNEILENSGLLR